MLILHIVIETQVKIGHIICINNVFKTFRAFSSFSVRSAFREFVACILEQISVVDDGLIIFENGVVQYSRFNKILEEMASVRQFRIVAGL